MSSVQIGKKVKNFQLPATGEKSIKLTELKGKNVVIYFYPKDNTPGCTKETEHFRDNFPKAIDHYQKALKIYEKNGYKKRIPSVSNSIGNIYSNIEEFTAANEYFQTSLEILQEKDDKKLLEFTHMVIGINFVFLPLLKNCNDDPAAAENCLDNHPEMPPSGSGKE